jgi:hypothetical protein
MRFLVDECTGPTVVSASMKVYILRRFEITNLSA